MKNNKQIQSPNKEEAKLKHKGSSLAFYSLDQMLSKKHSGFALISTIAIMALLLVVGLAMMSLSSVETNASSQRKHMDEAQANARMALMIAIGELQKTTGSDTIVTAPADALADASSPDAVRQLTGVWRSWEGKNHDPDTGMPLAPDYSIKEQTYDETGSPDGRFVTYLLSDKSQALDEAKVPPSITETSETVPLLRNSLAGDSDGEVHVVPTEIVGNDGSGSFAWWIQGENTKVRLRNPDEASTVVENVEQLFLSPGPSGSEFGIDDTSEMDKILSHLSLEFAKSGTIEPTEFFHDLSVHPVGLLTNVANGGFKRDLSLWSENFDPLEYSFSAFTLSPGEVHISELSGSPLMYPWEEKWTFADSTSWSALAQYMNFYNQVQSTGDPVSQLTLFSSRNADDWNDTVKHLPVVARIHLVISLTAQQEASSGDYVPAILINPVVTMWNPYSIAIDASDYTNFNLLLADSACPVTFEFDVGGESVTKDLAKITAHATDKTTNVSCTIPISSPEVWLPGEVRAFSPTGTVNANKNIGNSITFETGYRPGSGLIYELTTSGNVSFSGLTSTTQYSVAEEAKINATFSGGNVSGIGIYFITRLGSGSNSTTNINNMLGLAEANKAFGESVMLNPSNGASLSSLASNPQPILSVINGLRYARRYEGGLNPDETTLINGVHNMNPVVGFMTQGRGETGDEMLARFDGFPYNIQLLPINDVSDPGAPSGTLNDPQGYIASGFGSSDGLSNLILLDIPNRPLQTIGALQHFNINASEKDGPYTLNALGNSRTSPFIESDAIRVEPASGDIHGYDHSYAFNHVMMDDWFVSGVTKDVADFSASQQRSLEDVYKEHLTGEKPLVNHYYKALGIHGTEEADNATQDLLGDEDSYNKIAAELQVEGMFNVNSTSVLAWAMFLKKSYAVDSSALVLTMDGSVTGSGSSASLVDGNSSGTVFPRTVLTSDPTAGSAGFEELGQPRYFSDDQIMALATEIVEQVKARGPFLSLSEFYNRRLLPEDSDLALAGAVEMALINLEKSSDSPYTAITDNFNAEASLSSKSGDPFVHKFPAAAVGNPAYGYPGWTRQADVLRAVSGQLTARDDTFVVRTYGASKDTSGKVVAEVWCEAIVQRTPEYVSGDDKLELPTEITQPYGRKYVIKSFRYLNPSEV